VMTNRPRRISGPFSYKVTTAAAASRWFTSALSAVPVWAGHGAVPGSSTEARYPVPGRSHLPGPDLAWRCSGG
jgi:hypothetical protein